MANIISYICAFVIGLVLMVIFTMYMGNDLYCASPYGKIMKSNIEKYQECMTSHFPYLSNPLQQTADLMRYWSNG